MPELLIRPLDPADDADMDAFQDVYAAAELAEDPEVALYSREDGVSLLAANGTTSMFDAFGAFVDGRMVGESILMGSVRDNLELARALIWVDPRHQRQGYGGHLVAHLEEHARTRGRGVLEAQARVGGAHPGNEPFAERHGFTRVMTEIERRLPLPVDTALLDRLAAESAVHHTDYEIRADVGPVPAELRASYVDLDNLLLVEMPHGDLEREVARNTVADLDAFERERLDAGRTAVWAFALRDGVVVAFTDASVQGGDARHVDQYGTLVHPDHRGHRLGMAVKCAQLRLLSDRFRDRSYVRTTNAETNAHMVDINAALGFDVHQIWGDFEKHLSPPDDQR